MRFEVTGPIKLWNDDEAWHFFMLPTDVSAEIYEVSKNLRRGFNSVRVEATLNSTRWRTSVFYSAKDHSFMLPLKKAVRVAQNLKLGDNPTIEIELLDF